MMNKEFRSYLASGCLVLLSKCQTGLLIQMKAYC